MTRGSSIFLPAILLGACTWLFVPRTFTGRVPLAPRVQGATAMNGFREEFKEWRASLTADEQKLLLKQAQSEFDKKFRKSDELTKDIPEEKIASFAKVLQKFFDSEREDYKKEKNAKVPDYDALKKRKGDEKDFDLSLKLTVVEVDRDADRRYRFASEKIKQKELVGEKYPQSSPMVEVWEIVNNDTQSHEDAIKLLQFLKDAAAASTDPKNKAALEEAAKRGVPPVGEPFKLLVPQVLVKQADMAFAMIKGHVEKGELSPEEAPATFLDVINELSDNYYKARDEIEADVERSKAFYKSQKEMPGKTKADILKGIWAELPKATNKKVPPLDEEMLAELAKEPAVIKGEFRHSWGIADKLYKSVAIDSFGMKYLLGIFETKDEAIKAFEVWNAEYEKAGKDMREEMQQWGKQEQARLDADTLGQERLKKAIQEARR